MGKNQAMRTAIETTRPDRLLSARTRARFCWVLLCVAPLAAPAADIIDRIAVSVGNRVITASDLDREIRVTAFLSGAKPDFSAESTRATADRMIDQVLIRRELELSRYPVAASEEIVPALEDFKKKQYPNEEDYRRALESYGITELDVKDELWWQRTLLMFLGTRFRSGVQVSEQELRDYYSNVVEPAAKKANPGEASAFEDYRDQIEEKLAGERVDRDVEIWLKEARKRTEVVYHEEVLR